MFRMSSFGISPVPIGSPSSSAWRMSRDVSDVIEQIHPFVGRSNRATLPPIGIIPGKVENVFHACRKGFADLIAGEGQPETVGLSGVHVGFLPEIGPKSQDHGCFGGCRPPFGRASEGFHCPLGITSGLAVSSLRYSANLPFQRVCPTWVSSISGSAHTSPPKSRHRWQNE